MTLRDCSSYMVPCLKYMYILFLSAQNVAVEVCISTGKTSSKQPLENFLYQYNNFETLVIFISTKC